jgi:hypothetical protein
MITLLTTSAFWIGFFAGFFALIFVCFLYVWLAPGHLRRGVKKFEDQREVEAEKERRRQIWRQYFSGTSALILSLGLLATSCKKEPLQQPNGGTASSYSGAVTVTVNSNYQRSVLQVTNVTDNVSVLTWNYSGYNGDCPYTKSFTAQAGKQYKIYSYSTKNATDSTLFMVGSKPVYNYLQVLNSSGTVLYQHMDSVGTGSWRISANHYTIN